MHNCDCPPAFLRFFDILTLYKLKLSLLSYGRSNRRHYGSCPSVRPSFRPVRTLTSKTKKRRKAKFVVDITQDRWKRCANFQFKKSKVMGTAPQYVGTGLSDFCSYYDDDKTTSVYSVLLDRIMWMLAGVLQSGRRSWRHWEHVPFQRPVRHGCVQHTVDWAELSQHVHVLALLRLRVSHLSAPARDKRKVGRPVQHCTAETTQHDLYTRCIIQLHCRPAFTVSQQISPKLCGSFSENFLCACLSSS